MKSGPKLWVVVVGLSALCVLASAQENRKYQWRYYRQGNTGIGGDVNECVWIGPDGNAWVSGYNPSFEEGGVAKFIHAENRWQNISNVDWPELGSANDQGFGRVRDMVGDGLGNLYMGTWRGLVKMNLAKGPKSLKRFGPDNSPLPGGVSADISMAPDGSVWVSAYSSIWAGGGLTQYRPSTNSWTHFENKGGDHIAIQPKPTGGYYVWAAQPGYTIGEMERYDTSTGTWTSFPLTAGNPSHLVSLDSVDEAGNTWMRRWTGNGFEESFNCRRPNGTWINPPLPPTDPNIQLAAFRAYGNGKALMVNGFMELYQFNGTSWTNWGAIPHNAFIDDLDIDAQGNVWLVGSGQAGALRRDAQTGFWQRYTIVNTGNFDYFNNDVAVSPVTGDIYAAANAYSDVGGMTKFDGARWTGFSTALDYGQGGPWPFVGCPQSESVYVRPSNGHVVVNPINNFTWEFDGTSWTQIPGGFDQMRDYVEDSLGRLWGIPHYGGLLRFTPGGHEQHPQFGDWATSLVADPSRSGTIWACSPQHLIRTDGNYTFFKTIEDFPNTGNQFGYLAVKRNGEAWVSTWTIDDPAGTALLKVNAQTGATTIMRPTDSNWPFPGDFVNPMVVTPDGKLWLSYVSAYPHESMGICCWDGNKVITFPAPPGGGWDWGGAVGAPAKAEVKLIPGGYELWTSTPARGIAVLKVMERYVAPY